VDDWLSPLRAIDAELDAEHSKIRAKRAARKAEIDEFWNAWNAIVLACTIGDEKPGDVPDMSSFIAFYKLLKKRGWAGWPREIAKEFSAKVTKDRFQPGPLFVAGLLIEAGKPRATASKLAEVYRSFTPRQAPRYWLSDGAEVVGNAIVGRIDILERAETTRRITALTSAARRRPAIRKQLFAVFLSKRGLGPAAIRDRWLAENPHSDEKRGHSIFSNKVECPLSPLPPLSLPKLEVLWQGVAAVRIAVHLLVTLILQGIAFLTGAFLALLLVPSAVRQGLGMGTMLIYGITAFAFLFTTRMLVRAIPARCPVCGGRTFQKGMRVVYYECKDCRGIVHTRVTESVYGVERGQACI